jgi:riboflavin synthase
VFTGIIKELGHVRRIAAAGSLYSLEISCPGVSESACIGDSIGVNGVCLTVTRKASGLLCFDVMAETVRRTALAGLKNRETVNLEASLKAGGGLDGHFVLGHIDCIGTIKEIFKKSGEFEMQIAFPGDFDHLVVEKGSVAIDGVSLTVGETLKGAFSVYIIPHTLKETTLGSKKAGSSVNIEFDIIGKYIAKLNTVKRGEITESFLKEKGF